MAFEEEGFGLLGGDKGATIGGEGCTGCLVGVASDPEVAPDENPIIFDGEERGDLGKGELEPLGRVSAKVD